MDRPEASLEAVLVFLEGENTGSEIKIASPREFLIGRSEQCDIFIGEKKVSRKHAKLIATKEGLFLEDLESTNGTFVDGKKISNTKLNDGESIRIGMTVFQVNIMEGRALSSNGELVSNHGERQRLTVESSASDIPLDPDGDFEESLDIVEESQESSLDAHNPTLEKNPEIDIPLRHHSDAGEDSLSHSKKKPLSGDLSEMALPDILQMLKSNKRSGSLMIERGSERGTVYFKNGELIGAEIGEIKALKAIYRMLTFNEGIFELQSVSESFLNEKEQQEIDLPLENILLEGMRQIDELEKIKKGLPGLDVKLELNKECHSPLSKLHPKVLDILQLIIKYGIFSEVMNKSTLSDLETGKIVFYLIKKGYVIN